MYSIPNRKPGRSIPETDTFSLTKHSGNGQLQNVIELIRKVYKSSLSTNSRFLKPSSQDLMTLKLFIYVSVGATLQFDWVLLIQSGSSCSLSIFQVSKNGWYISKRVLAIHLPYISVPISALPSLCFVTLSWSNTLKSLNVSSSGCLWDRSLITIYMLSQKHNKNLILLKNDFTVRIMRSWSNPFTKGIPLSMKSSLFISVKSCLLRSEVALAQDP